MNRKIDTSQLKKQWELFYEQAYRVCYLAGVRFARILKSIVRFTRTTWRPVAHALVRLVDILLLRHLHGRSRPRTRRKGRVARVVNVLAPVLALVVLVFTVGYWERAEFALALKYGGTDIGYIADETAYASAAAMVRSSVINADGSFAVERAPELTISVMTDDAVLTTEQIRDRILSTVDSELKAGVGLYADGEFLGALTERETVKAQMDAVLDAYDVGKYDGVDFFADISLSEGVYPISAFTTEEALAAALKKLPIQTYKNSSYTETVKYGTVYIQDSSLPLGYETVVQQGADGRQRVHAQIIYVNGEELYETVVSVETLRETVDRVVKIGAQTYTDTSVVGDGVATGTFIWPLPYTKQISSYFASRWGSFHGAIDIANGSTNGKPIIASDGGTVVKAEYHGSYGYFVLIDHGNGFMTRYAHCSKLEVEAGDKVAQGQYIAKVGNTGYSLGAHLHFEIIKDGVLVDPLDYVQR